MVIRKSLSKCHSYLTFVLNKEIYAIGILSIKEIIEYGQLTEVPGMPAFIRGVINLRGAVVPVIDSGSRLGKSACSVSRRTCIVILEIEQRVAGMMVDAVNEVLDIPPFEIEPAPCFGSGAGSGCVQGMGKVDGRFVILLDVDKLLTMEEMSGLSGIGTDMTVAA